MTIPTGISIGPNLEIRSALLKVNAPIRAEKGSIYLKSLPINNLEKWGTIKPIKPINPPILTAQAANKVATAPIKHLDRKRDVPRLTDNSSPKLNKFNCRYKNRPINNASKIGKAVNLISCQPLAFKLPISQFKAAWILPSSACNNKVACMAPNKLLMATPPKTNLSTTILFPSLDKTKTIKVVKIAPIQAAKGIKVWIKPKLIKKTITNPDPADIPNKYGLAKPFLSIPCKRAPDIPREEPTNKEAINLGNLSSQIIVWLIWSPFWKIASHISLLGIKTEPLANENIEIIIKKAITVDKENKNLVLNNLIFSHLFDLLVIIL